MTTIDRMPHGSVRPALFLVPGCVALGLLSAWLSGSAAENRWFAALAKPALYPAPAAFGIVWTILYVMMGVALALVVAAPPSPARRRAIIAFAVQLALNLVWSPVFFAAHRIAAAQVVLVALALALAWTMACFARVRRRAAWLLLPYLAWVVFAGVLNWQFWTANPGA